MRGRRNEAWFGLTLARNYERLGTPQITSPAVFVTACSLFLVNTCGPKSMTLSERSQRLLEIVFCHELNDAAPGLVGIGTKPETAVACVLDKGTAVGVCEV
jgi:hypothetical protein